MRSARLLVECLEDRTVPAVYQVTGTADGLGSISTSTTTGVDYNASTLRAAIIAANYTVGVADTIIVPAGTYALTLAGAEEDAARTGDLDITDDLTIVGAGSGTTTIDATNLGDRVFDVFGGTSTAPRTVSLQGLTITGGKTVKVYDNLGDYGGGLRTAFLSNVTISNCIFSNNSAPRTANGQIYGVGGAIANDGNVTVQNSQFINNSSSNSGGAIDVASTSAVTTIQNCTFSGNTSVYGGAVVNSAQMTITGSTFSGNKAIGPLGNTGQGGALENNATVTMANCTLSGNTAVFGGAIYNVAAAGLDFCTLAGNTASYGGGVYGSGTTSSSYVNTIIAGNTASVQEPDFGGTAYSLGHNLIGNTANSSGWVASDLLNMAPKLGPLADNGGPTQTRALLAGSPAIDAAATSTLYITDQRGVSRPQGSGFDIGAFELRANEVPVAKDDSYTATTGTTLTVAAPGVLANDSDIDGDTLTAVLVSGPSHGTLSLNPDGSFTYLSVSGYTGSDSFTYKANDGQQDSNTATVTLTVRAPDVAPVATDDSYNVSKNNALTVAAPGVLGNDTDADNDPLTAILVSGPTHGTLTLNSNGSFSYKPAADYTGSDSFTYKANDGQLDSNVAKVSLSINDDAPVGKDDSFSVNKNSSLTVQLPGVLANDTDANGDALTALLVSGPAHGTLALNGDGSFSYTPATDYTGVDSFTYKANDGQLDSNTATVSLAVNDQAPVASNDAYSTNENSPLTISAPGVLANDSDPDGDSLTAVLLTNTSHGTVSLMADGSFTYTSAANYYGTDSFSYRASDGQLTSNAAVVTLTITRVDQAPVAVDDTYSTPEDTPLVVTLPTGQGTTSLTMVSDPGDWVGAGQTYSYTTANATIGLTGGPTGVEGSVTNATDWWYLYLNPPTTQTFRVGQYLNALRFPDSTHPGLDVFGDGRGSNTVTGQFTVLQADFDSAGHPLRFAADFEQHSEGATPALRGSFRYNYLPGADQGGVLANDQDADGDPLTAILVSGPSHGTLTLNANGSFSYTPNALFSGTDSFTYKANDGQLDSNVATVTITVNHVNHAPVASNDSYTISKNNALTVAAPGVLGNDSDVDGDPLTAAVVSNPTHGSVTLNPDGSFTYTPVADYTGPDSFVYRANDGQVDSNEATVSLSVSDDAPVAVADSYSVSKNVALTVTAAGVLSNDTDANHDALTATLVTGPVHGTLTLNASGSFTYTPAQGFTGTDSFTYQASDGQLSSNVATVTLTVQDDAPVAVNDSYSVGKNGKLTVAASGVLANDSDVNGDAITAVLVSKPTHGTLTLNANGSFTYKPARGYTGSDSFTYKASDGLLSSNVATVTITVGSGFSGAKAGPSAKRALAGNTGVLDPGSMALQAVLNDWDSADGNSVTEWL